MTPKKDINIATKEDLIDIDGIGDVTAKKIINYRPYKEMNEILDLKIGISKDTFDKLNNMFCVEEILPDLNHATEEQLMSIDRIGKITANKIVVNKPYESFDDLERRGIIGRAIIERLKSNFCVSVKTKIIESYSDISLPLSKQLQIPVQVPTQASMQVPTKVSAQIPMQIPKSNLTTEIKQKFQNNNQYKLQPEKIPHALKFLVWKTYASAIYFEAKCFCCRKNTISVDNFVCGHVISRKKGGELSLENLRPICGGCNNSMGSQNMFEFIKIYKLWSKIDDVEAQTLFVSDIVSHFLKEYYFDIIKKVNSSMKYVYSDNYLVRMNMCQSSYIECSGKIFEGTKNKLLLKNDVTGLGQSQPVLIDFRIEFESDLVCYLDLIIEKDEDELMKNIIKEQKLEVSPLVAEIKQYNITKNEFAKKKPSIEKLKELLVKEKGKYHIYKFDICLKGTGSLDEITRLELDKLVKEFEKNINSLSRKFVVTTIYYQQILEIFVDKI